MLAPSSILHVANLSITVATILRRTFEAHVKLKAENLYGQYGVIRERYPVYSTLKRMGLVERDLSRLLLYFYKHTTMPSGDRGEEALKILLAGYRLFPKSRYEIARSIVRLLARSKARLNLALVKKATEASAIYINSLNKDNRHLYVINAATASINGFVHTLRILEIDPSFLDDRELLVKHIMNGVLVNDLPYNIKRYAESLGIPRELL